MSITLSVWSCIATVQMEPQVEDRIKAIERLRLIAQENNEYREIIFEEGGVPPLQKLLKENIPLEPRITAVNALCLLADEKRANCIMKEMITTIVNRLSRTSPTTDQIKAANLVTATVEHNPKLKERTYYGGWTLTETKGMICLAKLVEMEQDELQYNCLMIIREITAIAESNSDFRRSAFKMTSLAAKAVVHGLLRIIKESDDRKLRIPAIKSIASLARSFSAKETQVISHLVALLDNTDQEVAMEAAIALQKFVCTENHLCLEYSK
ncbi:hypothetical protein DITRI_Ditri01bG0013900 [Diplodiscus trichospermus]